jgi:hypothetical protein
MQIHALTLSVTEQELNELAAALPLGKNSIQNLRIRLTSDGIVVLGEYPALLMKMAFETLWEVKGAGNIVEARLISVKVANLPAALLRTVLLRMLRDLLAQEPGVCVGDDSIQVDLSKHTILQKLRLGIHLTAVQCRPGNLVIEARSALV